MHFELQGDFDWEAFLLEFIDSSLKYNQKEKVPLTSFLWALTETALLVPCKCVFLRVCVYDRKIIVKHCSLFAVYVRPSAHDISH